MDRLLTGEEIRKISHDTENYWGTVHEHMQDGEKTLQNLLKTQDAKTMQKLIKWLFEPCDKHKYIITDDAHGTSESVFYDSHYLCPSCMAELKEAK